MDSRLSIDMHKAFGVCYALALIFSLLFSILAIDQIFISDDRYFGVIDFALFLACANLMASIFFSRRIKAYFLSIFCAIFVFTIAAAFANDSSDPNVIARAYQSPAFWLVIIEGLLAMFGFVASISIVREDIKNEAE